MISSADRTVLRELAKRVAEIAALPVQAERRELWKKHNSLQPTRPMILIFPEGSWEELLPESALTCEGEDARRIEWVLRSRLYYYDHFADDTVIENEWVVSKAIYDSGWGLESKQTPSTEARGAWAFDPVIVEPADLAKLRWPEIGHDEAETQRRLEKARTLFGDILDVKLKGVAHIAYHLMQQYTYLRGLAETMMDMYLQPQMLHDAMAFFEEGHRRVLQQYIDLNLLSINNDSTYHSSGGNGYTNELPAPGFDPGHVRPIDMWASAEAQELAQVGPRQHAEFALAYEKRLLEPFGLTGYGCCEDLTDKLDDALTIPRIRRISISPFANVDACAEKLGNKAIFSWKPHPSHLVGDFDEDAIRQYIRHTIAVAQKQDCVLEMVLKDTHTCEHHPERFDRWTQIVWQEVERVAL
ncbi:MAG: hypothetical protein JW934_02175 [Anaerolineae bacterium]|nr:hypothetical protein [Anaerolineae bacterium]